MLLWHLYDAAHSVCNSIIEGSVGWRTSQNQQLNIWNVLLESRVVAVKSSGDTLFGFDPCKRKQSIIDNGLLNLLHSSAVRIWTEHNLKHITSSLWLHLMVGLFVKFGSCGVFCSEPGVRYSLKTKTIKQESGGVQNGNRKQNHIKLFQSPERYFPPGTQQQSDPRLLLSDASRRRETEMLPVAEIDCSWMQHRCNDSRSSAERTCIVGTC